MFNIPRDWLLVAPRLVVGALSLSGVSLPAPTILADLACSTPPSSQLSSRIDNPDFPHQSGTTYTYQGQEDGAQVRDAGAARPLPAAEAATE